MKAFILTLLVLAFLALAAANVASAHITWNCVVTSQSPHLELCTPVGQVWERIPGR